MCREAHLCRVTRIPLLDLCDTDRRHSYTHNNSFDISIATTFLIDCVYSLQNQKDHVWSLCRYTRSYTANRQPACIRKQHSVPQALRKYTLSSLAQQLAPPESRQAVELRRLECSRSSRVISLRSWRNFPLHTGHQCLGEGQGG